MGNFQSRYFKDVLDEALAYDANCASSVQHVPSQIKPNNESSLSTPKCRVIQCDPRSPTEGITRTPIEVLSVQSEPEGKNSSEVGECTPSITRISKLKTLEADPRSPVSELGFSRTPIQVFSMSPAQRTGCESDCHSPTLPECTPTTTISKLNMLEDPRSPAFGLEFLRTPLQFAEVENDDEDSDENIEKMVPPTKEGASEASEDFYKEVQTCDEYSEALCQEIPQTEDDVEPAEAGDSLGHSSEQAPSPRIDEPDVAPVNLVDDLNKITLQATKCLLDTPKEKVQLHVANKENGSSVKNKLLYTPEFKTESFKPKVRTPLSTLHGNNSPRNILRDKQSTRINKGLSTGLTNSPQLVRTNNHP